MSFGFGIGDFVGVNALARDVYRSCYKVARDAPAEFMTLLGQVTILSQSLQLLQEEAVNPTSTMARVGPDRIRLLTELLVRVHSTLIELHEHVKKYDNTSQHRWKSIRAKSTNAAYLDALRNKVGS